MFGYPERQLSDEAKGCAPHSIMGGGRYGQENRKSNREDCGLVSIATKKYRENVAGIRDERSMAYFLTNEAIEHMRKRQASVTYQV